MNIVLNEREYAEQILQGKDIGAKPSETLMRLAKYFRSEKYKKSEIKAMLESFVLRCDPDANLSNWESMINQIIRGSERHSLIEIDYIPITRSEMKVCESLPGKQMQRLMFTLICLAKFYNSINEQGNGWVNKPDKEIFGLANIVTPIRRQSLMLNDLRESGFISFSKKVDNVNIRVDCLSSDSEVVMRITDYRNLGYQYMKYHGEPYFECSSCGLMIKRITNNQKYCPQCATQLNIKKTVQNRRKLAQN